MDQEEYLSDASLIEDDDEEEEEEIHLPYPMPTTVVSTMSYENTREITRVMEIEEANGSSEDEQNTEKVDKAVPIIPINN